MYGTEPNDLEGRGDSRTTEVESERVPTYQSAGMTGVLVIFLIVVVLSSA